MRRPLLVAFAALAVVAGCGQSGGGEATTGVGSLPRDSRSPLEPTTARLRVLVQLNRPSLADQMRTQKFAPGRQRAYVNSLHNEVRALQSSLKAKGVTLGSPVFYGRVWNGFAATIRARDLPVLQALGLRAEPVRRFFGAAAGEVAGRRSQVAEGGGPASVALLDTGVSRGVLGGRVVPGYDAVGHDSDPSPGGRGERHGTLVASVLASALGRAGGRILSIRVAGLRRDPVTGGAVEYGTSDELLQGLERAVDPNGDGDTSDHVPVALVGVNSPYAGFADSPEAQGAAAARNLGTLVVAPAGNEGPRAGRLGTVGSPAASPGVLAVGALEGGGAPALPGVELGLATSEGRLKADGALLGGRARPLRAPIAALTGPSQANPKGKGRAAGASPLEYFTVAAGNRAKGRVVVVPARIAGGRTPPLATRASAAAEAGAAALVVCEPDASRPLPPLPDGAAGLPVIGLRGDTARQALDLTPHDGGLAFISSTQSKTDDAPLSPGKSSSQGPTYALAAKPDLSAPGTAELPGGEFVAGTSVAAARVAAAAVAVNRADPHATPDEVAAALGGTATPRGPVLAAGAGQPQPRKAAAAPVTIDPAVITLPLRPAGKTFTATTGVTLRNSGKKAVELTPTATVRGLKSTVKPAKLRLKPGATRRVTVAVGGSRPAGYYTGTLRAGSATAVLAMPTGPPPPAYLSGLTLTSHGGATDGVRFTAGRVSTPLGAIAVEPLGDLTLQIVDAKGAVVRELTPQGGARDLLPGEYAYRLTKQARQALQKGTYRFVARAHGPAGGPAVTRRSATWQAR